MTLIITSFTMSLKSDLVTSRGFLNVITNHLLEHDRQLRLDGTRRGKLLVDVRTIGMLLLAEKLEKKEPTIK